MAATSRFSRIFAWPAFWPGGSTLAHSLIWPSRVVVRGTTVSHPRKAWYEMLCIDVCDMRCPLHKQADSQTFTTLLSFTGTGGAAHGENPFGSLTITGTTIYGITSGNTDVTGNPPYGNIFSIGIDGTSYQNLDSFTGTGGSASGSLPQLGSLTASGTTLYGMTAYGGVNGIGNIFSIGSDGSDYQNLYSFTPSGTGGSFPTGDLTPSGGTLFGMTAYGGASSDGTLFGAHAADAHARAGHACTLQRRRGRTGLVSLAKKAAATGESTVGRETEHKVAHRFGASAGRLPPLVALPHTLFPRGKDLPPPGKHGFPVRTICSPPLQEL